MTKAQAVSCCLLFFVLASAWGQTPERRPWSDVAPPELRSVAPTAGDPGLVSVEYSLVTGTDGADRSVVELSARGAVVEAKTFGKTKADLKTATFRPRASGAYSVRVLAYRTGVVDPLVSATVPLEFVLPLAAPEVRVKNLGAGTLKVSWAPVAEAGDYRVRWAGAGEGDQVTTSTDVTLQGLAVGQVCQLTVEARRNGTAVPAVVKKTIRAEVDRDWTFTWFGQSSSGSLNRIEVVDQDQLKLKLYSASFLPDGSIEGKGGKFTTFHDGISYYYTVIDPARENFELTATFILDAINPTPDGQEGFGLLAMDSLGTNGVSMTNHYTNSAGLLATKFGLVKDGLGARFVSGITPAVLAQGDTGIAKAGLNVSRGYGTDASDAVKKGQSYTLTLRKTNTGYETEYNGVVQTMYGADKLAALDPAHDYVGFAVARGCNVTVNDVRLTFSDPRTDPPGRPEPPEPVPLVARVDAPGSFGAPSYPFVFTANADGTLSVVAPDGKVLADKVSLKANDRWTKAAALAVGQNNFDVTFTVAPGFRPTPKTVVADPGTHFTHTVYHKVFPGKVIHVTPTASSLGDGSASRPVSLALALAFVAPGQTIELAGGTYYPKTGLTIDRGNDGTAQNPKVLRAAAGPDRPVLDFEYSQGGLILGGSWWIVEGLDVTGTVGNVKGIQVAGNHNVVRNVQTYQCGDTGLQISGWGIEPPALWPSDNLITGCTSWGNNDPAQNNADGFAAKLTCGPGNRFYQCLSYHNIDDGWDLFSKIETGPIAPVTIDSCVAWGNGSLPDGSGNGDGNGFKLGGDGIAVAHVLRNSIAFANGAAGITSNSDPAVVLERNTSYGNKGMNIALYGKGTGERLFVAQNNLSLRGGQADNFREMPSLADTNYFWTGTASTNAAGNLADDSWFVSTDVKKTVGRRADGSLDLGGLLTLTKAAAPGVGSSLR